MTQPVYRHAGVLPAFAVELTTRPLVTPRFGTMRREELLAWSRGSVPGENGATQLRDAFIQRERQTFDRIWDSCPCVRISPEVRDFLPRSERDELKPILGDEALRAALPAMTFREIKKVLRLKIERVLALLARLEAHYWVSVPPLNQEFFDTQAAFERIDVTPEFREQLLAVLNQPWVREMDAEDLRFPSFEQLSLRDWLLGHANASVMPGNVLKLCQRLVAAPGLTFEEELDTLLAAVKSRQIKTQGDVERRETMFKLRYTAESRQTYEVVTEGFGLSRQRIQQVCEAFMERLTAQPFKTPATDQILEAATRLAPISFQEVNAQLRPRLGPQTGIEAVLAFVKDTNRSAPVVVKENRIAAANQKHSFQRIAFLDLVAKETDWTAYALSAAHRDCQTVGCTNFIRIMGLVAFEKGIAPDLASLESIFGQVAGFRKLGKDGQWFTLGPSDDSALAARVKKVLAASTEPVDIDILTGVLTKDLRWFDRAAVAAMALPPTPVMIDLFSGWPWMVGNLHNVFRPKNRADLFPCLGDTEVRAMEFIRANGGVVTKKELSEHLQNEASISGVAVSFTVSMSPVIARLEKGIYGLTGAPINVEGLKAARERQEAVLMNNPIYNQPPGPNADLRFTSGPVEVRLRMPVSQVDIERQAIYLPLAARGMHSGRLTNSQGLYPALHMNNSGQLYRLAKVGQSLGLAQGETFKAVIDLQARTYEIPWPQSPTGEEPADQDQTDTQDTK